MVISIALLAAVTVGALVGIRCGCRSERLRIGSELHDRVGPAVAAAALQADAAGAVRAAEVAREALEEIRAVARGGRSPALADAGLLAAVGSRARALSAGGGPGVRIEMRAPRDLPALPRAVESGLFAIAGEAMANASRHSGASRCVVLLEVSDDGGGIPAARTSGVGLASIDARARGLGGRCEVGPAPGGGTRLRVAVPVMMSETGVGRRRS